MQIANAFGEVQKALSWLVDAYVRIAGWRASVERLDGFVAAIERARALGADLRVEHSGEVDLGTSQVAVPQPGRAPHVLVQTAGERIVAGQHTVIHGPSGSGKSTLFRLMSGIWPYASGRLLRPPSSDTLFLPQTPYLPLGSLREVVAYPRGTAGVDDAAIREALVAVRLPALADRLDEVTQWSQRLSLGEQQRLSIARALIVAPKWLFLDEATSALDPDNEAAMYRLLAERLPGTTRISIAHRPGVFAHHQTQWVVEPRPDAPARLREVG